MEIYTIGHSNLRIEEFLELLKREGIEILVDVRSEPYSVFAPQFNQEKLAKSLESEKIKYLYLGELLGGRPADKECYREEKVIYEIMRKKKFYQEGLLRLIQELKNSSVVIMCSEEDPFQCHRRNLIGWDIYQKGIMVKHLRKDGRVEVDDYRKEKEEAKQLTLLLGDK